MDRAPEQDCGETMPVTSPREVRLQIADRLRQQPWVNALPIADAIENDEWDV